MRQSELFSKVSKNFPADEEALNAKLLIRAGFINKEMAGVYSFLPLGLRVIRKIEAIIREEMEQAGGREVLMPVLHPKENWVTTKRWESFDALYKVKARDGKEMALGPTHEEIIFPLAKKLISSYKDLPISFYQIQDKMRDEARTKSGILRGREFLMKDFYSFHADEADLDRFYEKMKGVYARVFARLGLKARLVEASGGTFSKYSHEFQVLTSVGEDEIYFCDQCDFAENKEVFSLTKQATCPSCKKGKIETSNGIEVGNIFKLNTKFSDPFEVTYKDDKGEEKPVFAGCYGIGISRVFGTVAELLNDERGLVWPEPLAPFRAHLIELEAGKGDEVYQDLQRARVEVLYDDRKLTPGEKFAEADLIGIPWRLVVSKKTGAKVEVKRRDEEKVSLVDLKEFFNLLN